METICLEVTKPESDAIRMYASMCGESVPILIKKIVIQEITLHKIRNKCDPKSYHYNMQIPDGLSAEEEARAIEFNYNKIREILGWCAIRIS